MHLYLVLIINICFKSVFPYSFDDLNLSGIDNGENDLVATPSIDEYYEDIYMPYLFNSGVGNREGLVINDISVDETFPYGNGVINWKAIMFGGRQYLVGRQEHSVKLIQVKMKQFTSEKFNTLYFNETVMKFEGTIGPIVLTAHINYTSSLEEGFALVTELTDDHFQRIHWLKITTKGLVPYTTWSNPTRGEIIDLKWIKFDFKEFLLIVTSEDNNLTTIDISDYKLEEDKMRLMCIDKVKVDFMVSSVSTIVQGEELYMVLVSPHQHTIWLYRYHLNFYQVGGFKLLFGITSSEVSSATAFIQSGRNYFLTNGKEPNIYLLNRNGTFTTQLHNCGRVDEWLVLEVPTYRQDVVLLARDGDKVSLLTWRGTLKGFVVSEQPQCFYFRHMDKQFRISGDASCLAKCRWSGGAVLKLGHVPNLILACNSSDPDLKPSRVGGLYHFNVSLHSVHGPAEDIAKIFSQSQHLNERVVGLSQKFEDEGLLEEVTVSKGRLEEGWNGKWNGLENCLKELDDQVKLLSFYMEQRRQNKVLVNISLHQGNLFGSASGLMANQSVEATFKGKLELQAESERSSSINRVFVIDTNVLLDNSQHFSVKAKANLDLIEVAEITSIDGIRSLSGYGVSPEIQGPPPLEKNQVVYKIKGE